MAPVDTKSAGAGTVRHGAFVFHAPSPEAAAAYVFELKRLEGRDACGGGLRRDEKNDTTHMEEVLGFPDEFVELVASALGSSASTPGVALAEARELLPGPLLNDVRKLIRHRGAHAHPVPASRCKRVLADVSKAFSTVKHNAPNTMQVEAPTVPCKSFFIGDAVGPGASVLDSYVGTWESLQDKQISVQKCALGTLVKMRPEDTDLYELRVDDGDVRLQLGRSCWKAADVAADQITWEQTQTIAYRDGKLATGVAPEPERIIWTRCSD